MVVIGGLTRLTESGLSIVEWKLVSGILPPLTEESWQKEFEAYQASPQYQKVNKGMTVSDFKNIFWLEYLHRLLGRTIGLVALLPLFLLTLNRKQYFTVMPAKAGIQPVDNWLLPRMWVIALLIGLQGAIGWYMVRSGLIDVPWVSPYRLALHLGLAFGLLGLLTVTFLRLQSIPIPSKPTHAQSRLSLGVSSLVFIQILLGAFVAGLDAGLTYNTFPLMDGDVVPSGLWLIEPAWRNIFENVTMVNFLHRWFAFIAAAGVFLQAAWLFKTSNSHFLKLACFISSGLVILQIVLGISTLLLVVPAHLAVIHQAMAALLFISVLVITYLSWQSAPQHMPKASSLPVGVSS